MPVRGQWKETPLVHCIAANMAIISSHVHAKAVIAIRFCIRDDYRCVKREAIQRSRRTRKIPMPSQPSAGNRTLATHCADTLHARMRTSYSQPGWNMSSRQQKDSHESSGTPTSPDTAAHDELDGMLSAVALLRDRVAFETFYRRTSPKIFAICLKVLRDRSEAEDTLQDVYVTAWNHAATFNPQLSSALTWLGTIARNRAIDRIRRRRTQPLDEASAEEIVDDAPTPAALAQLSQKGSGSNAACRPCPTRREA